MRGAAHSLAALLAGLSGLPPVHAIYENAFGQYPDPCPKSCSEVGPDPINWTRIPRADALEYCAEPLLFEINVQNDLDGEGAKAPLRACSQAESVTKPSLDARQDGSPLSIANNCGAKVEKTTLNAQVTSSGDNLSTRDLSAKHLDAAVGQLLSYLERAATCGATIFFAKSGNVVAGLYSGAEIQHESAISLLKTFRDRVAGGDRMLQLCEADTSAARTLGVVVGTLKDLVSVQAAVKAWTNNGCVKPGAEESSGPVKVEMGVLVSSVAASTNSFDAASTPSRNRRALCRDIQVVQGDSCASLASRCGVSGFDFEKFNPKTNLCSTLKVKQYVCCTAGDLPDREYLPAYPHLLKALPVRLSTSITITNPFRHTAARRRRLVPLVPRGERRRLLVHRRGFWHYAGAHRKRQQEDMGMGRLLSAPGRAGHLPQLRIAPFPARDPRHRVWAPGARYNQADGQHAMERAQPVPTQGLLQRLGLLRHDGRVLHAVAGGHGRARHGQAGDQRVHLQLRHQHCRQRQPAQPVPQGGLL
jgi:hypothetical protein